MFSIHVNWSDNDILQNWDFVGAAVVYQMKYKKLQECPHGNHNLEYCDECGCYPEDRRRTNYPVMNFAYPLFSEPDEEKIIRVCTETSCTVIRNLKDDSYYLALTGGGMDLSQDIALAYIITDGCIAWEMLEDIYISGAFSVSEENYQIILQELERQFRNSIDIRSAKLQEVIKQLRK